MPAHADVDDPRVHLTLDFIVLLLGRALLLLADPTAKAAKPCDGRIGPMAVRRMIGSQRSPARRPSRGILEAMRKMKRLVVAQATKQ